jgi:photosystem II stability/assembly factor-like uncharacterized protein
MFTKTKRKPSYFSFILIFATGFESSVNPTANSAAPGSIFGQIALGVFLFVTLLLSREAWSETWPIVGPEGGTVRSLAYDPHDSNRIFLGTGTGAVFLSTDGGRHWSHCAQLGGGDYVLDHIVTDPEEPRTIFISAWSAEDPKRGDLFRSRDGGSTWESLPAMHGKSIRALAIAGTGPGMLVAGALDGIYRSADSGDTWKRISPEENAEIKNIQSVAVDPRNSNVLYAGTWHLPWKTSDGGRSWQKVSRGMEYDSDVFSIIVDAARSHVVFASACSGIYRSNTGGKSFRKVNDIPYSARRTHVLRQVPESPRIIFAGTTEGLWKTVDRGTSWRRASSRSLVVNDIVIDPRHSNRVLLATDRLGVLMSEDGGRTFSPSNHGYAHRYVTAIVVDRNNPARLYVGVANDREWGGVFSYNRKNQQWRLMNKGLGGRDVLSLAQTAKGILVAGTSQGVFVMGENARQWRPSELGLADDSLSRLSAGRRTVNVPSTSAISGARVNDLNLRDGLWLAATSVGLLRSVDEGKNWRGGPIMGLQDFIAVRPREKLVVAATRRAVAVSADGGTLWHLSAPPREIRSLVLTSSGQIMIATREGGFGSPDAGVTWHAMLNGLPETEISSIFYDEDNARLLAAAGGSIFESADGGRSWHRGPDAGLAIRSLSVAFGRIVAATFDGIVVEPDMKFAK